MTAPATTSRPTAPARPDRRRQLPAPDRAAPIVAAIDGSAASTRAVETAIGLAAETDASVVFVYVRRGPSGFFGAPFYQRRLTAAMARARRTLDEACRTAARAGVAAEGEILEGSPGERIPGFARDRGAQLVVVGHRRRLLGRSVSRAVARSATQPVVVAPPAGVASRHPG
jgi:nucleotide-binding universal stress UspA family protein